MVKKAVIPAAGLGTRMLPAAKAVPKEMLPIVDRPTIQYVVEECVSAGVDDVLLVTSKDKRALEDHFDRHRELEQRLAAGGKQALLDSINELMSRARIHSVRQQEQRGLGDAVLCAREHVGNEPFLCLLGDAVFSGEPRPAQQLVEVQREFGGSVVGLEEVPLERVSRYGVIAGTAIRPGIWKVESLVEKPRPEVAPSRLAIAARYVLSPGVFDCLARVRPGVGGEIQLTDALRTLLDTEPVHGVLLGARRHDIGNPADWLKANLVFARARPEVWARLEATVRGLLTGASDVDVVQPPDILSAGKE
ncbi:MAG: UTP--glucose-1-phosphate uridylyltransferase GalU [Tepidisphaeraceae bacterium]|jgi:UTP--glucose-1-phosphate uridylyltransferase